MKLNSLLLTLFIFPFTAFAGGPQVYEQADPAIGTANVGQAALANDASTAYFNPAGMTQLDTSQMMVGTQVFFTNIHFGTDQNNTFTGVVGGQAGGLLPGAGIFDVFSFNSDLKFGISVVSPYGGYG